MIIINLLLFSWENFCSAAIRQNRERTNYFIPGTIGRNTVPPTVQQLKLGMEHQLYTLTVTFFWTVLGNVRTHHVPRIRHEKKNENQIKLHLNSYFVHGLMAKGLPADRTKNKSSAWAEWIGWSSQLHLTARSTSSAQNFNSHIAPNQYRPMPHWLPARTFLMRLTFHKCIRFIQFEQHTFEFQ